MHPMEQNAAHDPAQKALDRRMIARTLSLSAGAPQIPCFFYGADGSHAPWRPSGTRLGRCTVAMGPDAGSAAGITSRRLVRSSRSVAMVVHHPWLGSGSPGRGMNVCSPTDRFPAVQIANVRVAVSYQPR